MSPDLSFLPLFPWLLPTLQIFILPHEECTHPAATQSAQIPRVSSGPAPQPLIRVPIGWSLATNGFRLPEPRLTGKPKRFRPRDPGGFLPRAWRIGTLPAPARLQHQFGELPGSSEVSIGHTDRESIVVGRPCEQAGSLFFVESQCPPAQRERLRRIRDHQ